MLPSVKFLASDIHRVLPDPNRAPIQNPSTACFGCISSPGIRLILKFAIWNACCFRQLLASRLSRNQIRYAMIGFVHDSSVASTSFQISALASYSSSYSWWKPYCLTRNSKVTMHTITRTF